jgi:hypothetical protein
VQVAAAFRQHLTQWQASGVLVVEELVLVLAPVLAQHKRTDTAEALAGMSLGTTHWLDRPQTQVVSTPHPLREVSIVRNVTWQQRSGHAPQLLTFSDSVGACTRRESKVNEGASCFTLSSDEHCKDCAYTCACMHADDRGSASVRGIVLHDARLPHSCSRGTQACRGLAHLSAASALECRTSQARGRRSGRRAA